MKLLVTGATGFVGYHFARYAKQQGYELACTVRASSDTKALEELGVNLLTCDLQNREAFDESLKSFQPDVIVHCAGCVSAPTVDAFSESNVQVTQNVCEAALKQGVKRLVYLSSVDVNSANPELPIREELPYLAMNPYGNSKIEAEKIVVAFQAKGLNSVVLRPTTIIGEGEPHGMPSLLPLIMKRRLPFPGLPDLKDQIHIVYIGNLVEAMELALVNENAINQTFNICDEEPTHIKYMIDVMVDELACKAPRTMPAWLVKTILLIPALRNAFNSVFKDWAYDISKAQALLNYQPSVSSEEGMRRTVRHWKYQQMRE